MDDTKKQQLGKLLKIDEKRLQILAIEKEMSQPDFWVDYVKANQLVQKLSPIKKVVTNFENAQTDEEIVELEVLTLLSDKYDQSNAILTIHAGAGGTEAQDWGEMLLRMYERYAEKMDYKTQIIQISKGEEAGIKSATLLAHGTNAFGFLKAEAGVHRLVRLSPYDADNARHTSFALVEVIPEISTQDIEAVPDKDLRIDVYHAQGHGGQGVNTTDSAVRITHLPTNTVVTCQNERSQTQNKELAMKLLLAKLNDLKMREHKEKLADLRGEHLKAEWGSQIRSYVLHPYQMVKDHRTGVESNDPDSVLGGNLQEFIEGYLRTQK